MNKARSEAPRRLIDLLKLATEHLAAKGIDSARLDAELLLADALEMTRVTLYTNHERPLAAREVDRFRELIRRRIAREPVAYILGRREFWSLEFAVDRRVLIPRPETEILVETAVRACTGTLVPVSAPTRYETTTENGAGPGFIKSADEVENPPGDGRNPRLVVDRLLDLGTGSGAIAIALAVELPGLAIVATDESAASLEVAPRNAARHGVVEKIDFRHGDLYDALDPEDVFEVIVSNPPYCKESEVAMMEPEVRDWEPKGALVGGTDGMQPTRRIIEGAARHLSANGWLLLEVGTQAVDVRTRLEGSGWRDIRTFRDLAGHDRVIAARAPTTGTA